MDSPSTSGGYSPAAKNLGSARFRILSLPACHWSACHSTANMQRRSLLLCRWYHTFLNHTGGRKVLSKKVCGGRIRMGFMSYKPSNKAWGGLHICPQKLCPELRTLSHLPCPRAPVPFRWSFGSQPVPRPTAPHKGTGRP